MNRTESKARLFYFLSTTGLASLPKNYNLKNSIHLDKGMPVRIISKNKDTLKKIIFPPKKIALLCAITSTLIALSPSAIAETIVEKGAGHSSHLPDDEKARRLSTELGYGANVHQPYSTALGSYASSKREYNDHLKERIKKKLPSHDLIGSDGTSINYQFAEVSVGGIFKDDGGDGLNLMKHSQITHVAPGTKDTDAVNLFQTKNIVKSEVDKLKEVDVEKNKQNIEGLKKETADFKNTSNEKLEYVRRKMNSVEQTAASVHAMAQKNTSRINSLEHQLSKTNKKIDRGLAASAALTGLFQPYGIGKVNVTAGLGGYGSSQALAIGTGYRISENMAIKAGAAYSAGSSIMYNASFNVEW